MRMIVKERELQGLHNCDVFTLENTKQEKQHLREENERLKQELRTVKIQLSKQPASACAWRTVMRREARNQARLSLYRILSVDRQVLTPTRVG